MPYITSTYSSFFSNGHVQTILPNLFRNVKFVKPREEEITLPDSDFLQLDWYDAIDSDKLIILSHGLEGNSRRTYMLGMAKYFHKNGYNVLCWNYRSCGTKMNKLLRFYHTGDIGDIHELIVYASSFSQYKQIGLIGFSMGGNITLKYLGKNPDISSKIIASCVFSAPVDLAGSSVELMKGSNKLYMARFIRKLRKKVATKAKLYPNELSLEGYENIKNFKHFDDKYTAPIHGFKNAEDYWNQASSLPYLKNISIPSLLINAKNDTFLSNTCFPYDIAEDSSHLYFEAPDRGGHVGFWEFNSPNWAEKRALEFISQYFN